MKIYTKTGDDGTTGLFGGSRVRKDHARIEAYGTVDELNSFIGAAASAISGDEQQRMSELLQAVQKDLFVAGADLATPAEARPSVPRIDHDAIERLENWIDELEEDLDNLKTFILPGGTQSAALLHIGRTICRRAERAVVTMTELENVDTTVSVYLNRLSDFLFVAARWMNKKSGKSDIPWIP